jgi:hypothetical protein
MVGSSNSQSGQAIVVEATGAAVLLLTTILFVQQFVLLTPLANNTASTQVEVQQQERAEGLLGIAKYQGELKQAILTWDATGEEFDGSPAGTTAYILEPPDNQFGDDIMSRFLSTGIGVQVDLTYINSSGNEESVPYLRIGTPTGSSYTATETVTLYDSDPLYNESGSETGETLESVNSDGTKEFFAPDVSSGPVYNVIGVKFTIWKL